MLHAIALALVILEKPKSGIDSPGVLSIWTPGAWLVGFMKGATKHCYIQNIEALGVVVSEKKLF